MTFGNAYTTSEKKEESKIDNRRRLDHIYEDLEYYSNANPSLGVQNKHANATMYADLTTKSYSTCMKTRLIIIIAGLILAGIVISVVVIMAVLATKSMGCFYCK